MDTKFAKIISSRLFTFAVGAEGKRITVHSEVLASVSSELGNLLNARLVIEGLSALDWPDVEEGTFIRLCEYAYVGDYTPPPNIIRVPQPSDTTNQSPSEAHANPFTPVLSSDRKRIYSKSWRPKASSFAPRLSSVRNKISGQSWRPPAPPNTLDRSVSQPDTGSEAVARDLPWIFNPSSTRDAFKHLHSSLTTKQSQAYEAGKQAYAPRKIPLHRRTTRTPDLLAHVKLYVLADQYGIARLRDLVLGKLATTLEDFELFEDHVHNLIEVVRISYLHTLPRDDERSCLRNLLVTYVFSRLKQLSESAEFQQLGREGGQFTVDVRQKRYNWRLRWGQWDWCKRPDPFDLA
ncbi:hypothetical protein BO82DRAFT_398688 [Aspergillus uvarum CBS 121591]|uniref:BTB domain-containing protein n=1 Tax=Aspergillus uvarum CBS 121591 TaxID=1448315 RepID=A0A319DB32_9EURO|nr:hypothetical protein BO82DRAFT_398688 [Aspergillus uvarum CBS 121591]PYH85258.1 hypothetical protein BO82DRAFT_398688 [Aspergillus uvarum CBS 121591]